MDYAKRRVQIKGSKQIPTAEAGEAKIEAVKKFLSEKGVFAVIIPFNEEIKFVGLAKEVDLFPFKITRVKGATSTEIKRSLLAFSRIKKEMAIDELVIEIARHEYTDDYIALTKDFYLKMKV